MAVRLIFVLAFAVLAAGEAFSDNLVKQRSIVTSYDRKTSDWRGRAYHHALKLGYRNLAYYQKGLYGKYESSVVFIASKTVIPDFERLYWVMVKVLSEKYGCFISNRRKTKASYYFKCKDKRIVRLTRDQSHDLIYFHGKQYDRRGRELWVEQGRIKRVIPSMASH